MQWEIVGHTWAVRQLQRDVAQDDVPHAMLITGPESVGKSTLARIVAGALLCKGDKMTRPCGVCLACRKLDSGNHPDFLPVVPETASSALRIDQIRAAERFLSLTPNESAHKVVLIKAFERASISAANALLKTLEEPPAYAHIILLAQDADVLLPTIVSRSQQIHLRPLSRKIIEQALIDQWRIPAQQAQRLARISGGRIGWAVRAVTEPAYQQRMEEAFEALLDLLGHDLPTRFEHAQALANEDDAHIHETLACWLMGWRDVLLIQTGNAGTITYAEQLPRLKQVAEGVDVNATVRMIKTLESAQEALDHNANTQLLIENLFLVMPTLAFGT